MFCRGFPLSGGHASACFAVLRLPTIERSVMLCCYNSLRIGKVPCEQRFLSYMAFSVYEVARVACQASQFTTDKRRERLCKR